ncbi:A/G-specific adenine glycosylase [Candidatus Dependentiae bacterium]
MKSISDQQLIFLGSIDYSYFSRAFAKSQLDDSCVSSFCNIIYQYYKQFGRVFSWRKTTVPYEIVVSEIMLQQTQTYRVAGKFERFISEFPNFHVLATSSLSAVLACWQGLGYNRRAKALHELAKKVMHDYGGVLPKNEETLQTFSGIGPATAASICAFAFNMPTVFIETNIRSLFIHFFFGNTQEKIKDKQIMPLVERTLDLKNPCVWYYALTDYGVALKKINPQLNAKSLHHVKQSRFEGSNRQIRGEILRMMLTKKGVNEQQLLRFIAREPDRVRSVLSGLISEGFIKVERGRFEIA